MTRAERGAVAETLVVLTAAWGLLFLLLRFGLLRRRSHDFSNRAVSLVHCAMALALCSLSIQDWSDPLAKIGQPNSPEQMRLIVVSLAYFLYDFVCCLFERPVDWVISIHHVFSVLGFAFGIYAGTCGAELVACLWLMELSNPCMHVRELFKELRMKDSAAALANDLLFALCFTLGRIIIGPYVTYKTLVAASPVGVKMGAVGIQVISLFWFSKIIQVALYKAGKLKKKQP